MFDSLKFGKFFGYSISFYQYYRLSNIKIYKKD